MKTDRELLELAAKAARFQLGYLSDIPHMIIEEWSGDPRENPGQRAIWWNPLTDDGDAVRLLARLEMGIQLDSEAEIVTAWWNQGTLGMRQNYSDIGLIAGLRRSIVRAAAAIGESMP